LLDPQRIAILGFMALKGKAKTEYQREYMRRRRAGQTSRPQPKGKALNPTERQSLEARIRELEAELERIGRARSGRRRRKVKRAGRET
jgi:hypothetical protein